MLAKENLFDYKPKVARRFISEWDQLELSDQNLKALVIKYFSYLPAGSKLLVELRSIYRLFS